jgi:hypothetical protein
MRRIPCSWATQSKDASARSAGIRWQTSVIGGLLGARVGFGTRLAAEERGQELCRRWLVPQGGGAPALQESQ